MATEPRGHDNIPIAAPSRTTPIAFAMRGVAAVEIGETDCIGTRAEVSIVPIIYFLVTGITMIAPPLSN